MGSQFSQFQYTSQLSIPQNCKLYSSLPIDSANEQQQMVQIMQKRVKLAQCPYICTVRGYNFMDKDTNKFTCSQNKKLVVYYEYFDYRLSDVSLKNYKVMFTESQICHLIKCICSALLFFRKFKLHHGDISLQNICRKGNIWKLIDKVFIKNGINAYQKVLQGEPSFISPKQMMRIRYGFIRESPQLSQADDVFGLGMVVLQLASGVPSSLCYKQQNVRFNQDVFYQNVVQCRQIYSKQFCQLLQKMIEAEEQQRIKLDQIIGNPLILGKINPNIDPNLSKVNSIRPSLDQSTLCYGSQAYKNNLSTNLINSNKKRQLQNNNTSGNKKKPHTPSSYSTHQNSKQTSRMVLNTSRIPSSSGQNTQINYDHQVQNGNLNINNYPNHRFSNSNHHQYQAHQARQLIQNSNQGSTKYLINPRNYPQLQAQVQPPHSYIVNNIPNHQSVQVMHGVNLRNNSLTPHRLKTIN